MIRKIVVFCARLSLLIYTRCRILVFWSTIHRFLFDWSAKNVQLPTFKDTDEMVVPLEQMVWRPDSLIDLWDAWCTPEMVWKRFTEGKPVEDCDGFANWIHACMVKSIQEKVWEDPALPRGVLTVVWMDSNGKMNGHNVALLWSRKRLQYGYMDYGQPKWFGNISDVAAGVRNHYAGEDNTSLGYALHSSGLTYLNHWWK